MMVRKKGSRDKLREYFLSNTGKIINSDELREVAGGVTEWARRVRELRTEEGYKIQTHNDRTDLKPGQYILEDSIPEPAFERTISKEVRAFVIDRNGFTCQMCGAVAGEIHPYNLSRKTRLYVGHVVDKSQGGTDNVSNLRALCSVCNEGASNLTLDRPSAQKLLIQVRRAKRDDQLKLLNWLINKFPEEVKK